MRAFCIAGCVAICFNAIAQNNIVGWEAYFDTDNGPGTGQWFPVASNDTVNVADMVDASSIGVGFHKLFVRFKTSGGLWSSPNVCAVFVQPDVTPPVVHEVIACEYYVGDVDPGLGAGTPIPLDSIASEVYLQRELDLLSLGLPNGNYGISIRYKSSSGIWCMFERRPFTVCDTYGALAGFDIYRSGSSVSFVDQSQNATSMFYDFGDGQTDTVWNPYHIYAGPGNYTVTQIATNSCATNTLVQVARLSGLKTYYPQQAGNGGYCTMDLTGVNFSSTMSFRLFRAGSNDILPDSIVLRSQSSASCLLHLLDVDTGWYDMELVLPGDTTIVVQTAFLVSSVSDGDLLTSTIVGPTRLRVNQWANYTITVHNPNSNDVFGVPLWVAATANVDVEWLTPIESIPFDGSDTLQSSTVVDSLWGRTFDGVLYPFVASRIPAFGTITLLARARATQSSGMAEFISWVDQPLFGFSADTTSFAQSGDRAFGASQAWDCISCVFKSLPGFSCGFAAGRAAGAFGEWIGGRDRHWAEWQPILSDLLINCGEAAIIALVPGGIEAWLAYTAKTLYDIKDNECVTLGKCVPDPPSPTPIPLGGASDPNGKYGPRGATPEGYVARDGQVTYLIAFENVDTAILAAQRVVIIDTLDGTVLNISDARLGAISLGDSVLSLATGQTSIAHVTNLGNGYELRINADIDTATHVARWDFFMADTTTHDLPSDPSAGFLPPNLVSPQGQGYVRLLIPMQDGLLHEQSMVNQASIIFDNNEPIVTEPWLNTIDALPPTSNVAALPSFSPDTVVSVAWSGSDSNSGVAYYEVYSSADTSAGYDLWTITGDTSALFIGEDGMTYHFYSIAIDSVGNREVKVDTSETQTQIDFTTGLDLLTSDMALGLFPNPTTGQVTLRGHTEFSCTLRMEVLNALGQVLLRQSFATGPGLIRRSIDVSSLATGAYVLAVTCNDAKLVERMIRVGE